ncbi:LPXTG cell wall anchor domain-containing protein [Curtobacterium poinsettiae]|uniref:LPXTG cell wall anchor domain-containing protein n=1 Tax=Curtobacterium poinsettiae TaxID=159612 RepID=A0A9Q9PC67_9MICO|nr:LPXTG cell wall anchor domain-containing protein [Curtobacterium flaccumfaciens]UYC82525.1 LPXTG cell wall anchor domain-containing protein [Curtobacterium flaccumfaciens pv. poinsettiae]
MNTRTALSCVAVAALASLVFAVPAHADEASFTSSKQPYIAPSQSDIDAYSPAPTGYAPVATESVARHGSRGLSAYKYDALLHRLAATAQAEDGFLTPEIGKEFSANLDAITAANVANGYGMLTGQGAAQHQGIGARAAQRNKQLFAAAAKTGGRVVAETSGESRATESGENFLRAFGATGVKLEPRPDLLYFHEVENPDGTEKAEGSPERQRAQAYQDYVAAQTGDGGTIAAALQYIEAKPRSVEAANDLLSGIFTPAFIAAIGTDKAHTWYNTADGSKGGAVTCAPGADTTADPDACGDPKKSIKSTVDAAMALYNLYIIAADMQEENVAPHAFDFAQYFAGRPADAEWFAYLLDAEDFYEKGPSLAGHDETYSIAEPLLDDFFATIDARVAGGNVVATFRFAHAETIIPFAALLRLPGSTVAAPDNAAPVSDADVYDDATNPWRGSEVTPMAANVQWDVVSRAGIDPATGAAYTPLVRMLDNEREIAFASGCRAVAAGSHWVKETELKHCLTGTAMTESPLIAAAVPGPTATPTAEPTPTPTVAPAAQGAGAPTTPATATPTTPATATDTLAATGAESPVGPALLATLLLLAGAGTLVLRRRRRPRPTE